MATKRVHCTGDATIFEGSPSQNYASDNTLLVRKTASHGDWWSMLKFESHGLPASSRISSAYLGFLVYTREGSGRTVGASGITGSWSESTVTWNNAPGRSPAGTRYNYNIGSLPASQAWHTLDITLLMKQMFSGEVAYSNGIYLYPNTMISSDDLIIFSRENSNTTPYIDITYTPPAQVLVGSTWRDVINSKVLINGVWRDVTDIKVLVNGSWRN